MPECMTWGVWCYTEGCFVDGIQINEYAARDAAKKHADDKGHKCAAQCASYWPSTEGGGAEEPAAE